MNGSFHFEKENYEKDKYLPLVEFGHLNAFSLLLPLLNDHYIPTYRKIPKLITYVIFTVYLIADHIGQTPIDLLIDNMIC